MQRVYGIRHSLLWPFQFAHDRHLQVHDGLESDSQSGGGNKVADLGPIESQAHSVCRTTPNAVSILVRHQDRPRRVSFGHCTV